MFTPQKNFDELGNPVLTIISKEDCPQCLSVKNLLEQRKIPHKLLMVGESIDMDEVLSIGARSRSFPIVFNGEIELNGAQGVMQHLLATASAA